MPLAPKHSLGNSSWAHGLTLVYWPWKGGPFQVSQNKRGLPLSAQLGKSL